MNSAAGPVRGYVFDPPERARTWHLNPNCRALPKPVCQLVGHSASAALLARRQSTIGRAPCAACTLTAVLDAMVGGAAGPGYHWVGCADTHSDTTCAGGTCATLADYAQEHHLVVTACGGRTMLLRPGALTWEPSELACGRLAGCSAQGADLPVIDDPMWESAATLVHDYMDLGGALRAIGALYANPSPKTAPAALNA